MLNWFKKEAPLKALAGMGGGVGRSGGGGGGGYDATGGTKTDYTVGSKCVYITYILSHWISSNFHC